MAKPEQELANAYIELNKQSPLKLSQDQIDDMRAGVVSHYFKNKTGLRETSVFGWIYGHTPESSLYFPDPELDELISKLGLQNYVIPHILVVYISFCKFKKDPVWALAHII